MKEIPSKEGATPEEREEVIAFYRELCKMMDGKDYDVLLNTLCFVMGELGTELDMTKQLFIAQVVEHISSSFDMNLTLGGTTQ